MRMWRWLLVLAVLVGAGVGVFLLRPVTGAARDLTLAGDAERGNYLIRIGGCVACHTAKDAAFLSGGAALKTAFGDFVPPNITPDPEGGIGKWTFAEFSSAMSDGVGPGGKHYYPSFPYDNYTRMSDQEIADLWAGLQAVEPVAEKAAEHSIAFPFNIRLAMLPWKNLFFKPGRLVPDPDRSEAWNRGAYLVNGPGHCVACHTPRNLLGARDENQALKGSTGTPAGTVPAIDRDGLITKGYDAATLADVLNGGITPEFDVPGGAMNEVIREGTIHWTAEDRAAVAEYLLGE